VSGSRTTASLDAIRMLVLDVDGVLTDGRLYYGAGGEALKVFHVRDGAGLKELLRAGIQVCVISGRNSEAVTVRCTELGITNVEQGCEDKVAALHRVCKRLRTEVAECLCVVDDASDLSLMKTTGFAVAVADAHAAVLDAADRVTVNPGGRGAVREVCDWLLAARGGAT